MIKKNIATNELGFVFNPSTGDSFSCNPVAAAIIQMMKDQKSMNEIKKMIFDTYEVDKATIEKDLDEFVHTLKEYYLLTS